MDQAPSNTILKFASECTLPVCEPPIVQSGLAEQHEPEASPANDQKSEPLKNGASPAKINQQPNSSCKARLITDYLPPIAQQTSAPHEVLRHFDYGVSSSTKEDRVSAAGHDQTLQDTTPLKETTVCQQCGCPYPIEASDSVPALINGFWECEACMVASKERMIAELKENARRRLAEREVKELEKKRLKDEARQKRETELQQRREAKLLDKERNKIRRASGHTGVDGAGDQDEGASLRSGDGNQNGQSKINADAEPRQSKLKIEKKKTRIKAESSLTPEEREKLEFKRMIRNQLQIFSKLYPELVDRTTVKYPIEDSLIAKLPELHGVVNLRTKPSPCKIQILSNQFDSLLYIWEFCNNFVEYLEIPEFKLEELQLALEFAQLDELPVDEEEEPSDWNEFMRLKQVRENGLHFINALHFALARSYLLSISQGNESALKDSEPFYHVLLSLHKLTTFNNGFAAPHAFEFYWPEAVRLILISRITNEGDAVKAFGAAMASHVQTALPKLVGLNQKDYSVVLTYDEKVSVLLVLIDGIHDLVEFRSILNQRLEDKTQLNKDKIDLFQQIKQLELQQQEVLKQQAESDYAQHREERETELTELEQRLQEVSRMEAKWLKKRIWQLKFEQNQFESELNQLEDQIRRKHTAVAKLNEKVIKCNVRTAMLGQDAEKNEYWNFKDDPTRLYVRQETTLFSDEVDEISGEQLVQGFEYEWFYFDEEDAFDELVEALNPKGVRERRLQESLRKLRERMKFKKARKTTQQEKEQQPAHQDGLDVEMDDGQASAQTNKSSHRPLFERVDYSQCLADVSWFGKKIPPKRRYFSRKQQPLDTGAAPDVYPEMLQLRQKALEIETKYTELSVCHNREWTDQEARSEWIQAIYGENCDIENLLMKLDDGMSLPTTLLKREDRVQRLKLQLFKFWPNSELREAWRSYLSKSAKSNNLAVGLSLEILAQTCEQFAQRQAQKAEKAAAGQPGNKSQPDPSTKQTVAVSQPARRRGEFVKYFVSSESESYSEEEAESVAQSGEVQPQRARAKPASEVVSPQVSDKSSSDEGGADDSREWDEYCFICNDGGSVICCDGCSNVAHLSCLKMKVEPKDEWHCKDCHLKMAQRRQTRNQSGRSNGKPEDSSKRHQQQFAMGARRKSNRMR